jgi:hypothetical protein
MTTTLNRPNRYAGTCIRCNGHIPAGEGLLARTDTGAWAVDHDGPCPDKPTAAAEPVRRVEHDGIYLTDDGTIYKVQQARQGNGRLYAKRLQLDPCTLTDCGHPTITDEHGTHWHGHFVYAPGAIHNLRADQQMTADDARAFGRLYGVCARCGADLTDETSIAAGMGPICAGRI